MIEALTLPEIPAGVWQLRTATDVAGRVLADRHYSRQTPGSPFFTPPGYKLVFLTPCERAVWASVYSLHPDDELDAWRCTIFRREGGARASDLIRAAMDLTAQIWGGAGSPPDGWVTYVDRTKVRSVNPGYCFLCAGWRRDHTYEHPRLIRLRAAA